MPLISSLEGEWKACGDKVVILKMEKQHERVVGGIVVPYETTVGFNLCKGVVKSVGPDVGEGIIEIGDVVLFDHHSTYGETYPLCVTKIENVIVAVEPDPAP